MKFSVSRLLRLLLPVWLSGCSHSGGQPPAPTHVLGAHPDAANDRAYLGSALVLGERSAQELFETYPRREPDAKIAARLAEILADEGRTLRWSASGTEEFFQNGEVWIPIILRVPPPCADRPCPVIVHYSGGCARPRYHWRAEFFLRAGYIFAEPNNRGTSCSEEWRHADDGPKRLEAQMDIEACGRFLRKRFTRDGKAPKVGVLGWSFGGNETLVAMTRFAGVYDAGFALSAKTDLYSFFKNAPEGLRAQRSAEYGDPDVDADLMRSTSAAAYVDRIEGPIAIMLGGRDPKVSLSDADTFVRAARRLHKDVSLMIVPAHGHLTEKPREIVFEHAHALEFFSEKLGHPLDFR